MPTDNCSDKSMGTQVLQPWFKFWNNIFFCPVVQMLSEADQRRLICLWSLRCRGLIPYNLTPDEVAYELRISVEDLLETKKILVEKGLITENWDVVDWVKLQAKQAKNGQYVRKNRDAKKLYGVPTDVNPTTRVRVHDRDDSTCVYCGSKDNPCVDHLIPLSKCKKDPESLKHYNSISNLAIACRSCNQRKGEFLPEDLGFTFFNKDIEKLYLSSRASVLAAVTSVSLTEPSVSLTMAAPEVTYGSNVSLTDEKTAAVGGKRVENGASWPDEEKVKSWKALYPLADVDERLNYIKQHLKSDSIEIKNKTEKGIDNYIKKALQEEQKKKETHIDNKVINELSRRYSSVGLKRLDETLLNDIIFKKLPYHHASMVAKARGLSPFTIEKDIGVYRDIVEKAKQFKDFDFKAAEALANEAGLGRLHRVIRRFVKRLDEEKSQPNWMPS